MLIAKELRNKTAEAAQGLATGSGYHPWTEGRPGGDDVPRNWQEQELRREKSWEPGPWKACSQG